MNSMNVFIDIKSVNILHMRSRQEANLLLIINQQTLKNPVQSV